MGLLPQNRVFKSSTDTKHSPEDALLPQIIVKPLQRRVRILHILLRLLAHVENRTILRRTQHVLSIACKQILDAILMRQLSPDAMSPDTAGTASTGAQTGSATPTPS